MVAAGETIVAGKVPGERIATTKAEADSGSITTTETVIMTVVAPVVIGRIYKVHTLFMGASSVTADQLTGRIREDNVSGTVLYDYTMTIDLNTRPEMWILEDEYTADATEDKTFVTTLVRLSGSGNARLEASTIQPAHLYVDYIRDA